MNLGADINTSGDEASISLTPQGDTAYIVSTDPLTLRPGIYVVCLADSLRPFPTTEAASSVRTLRLLFAFNQWKLRTHERQRLAEFLKELPPERISTVVIEGHTDDIGSEQYNEWLSRQRAEEVATELLQRGIRGESLQIVGYGSRRPAVAGRSAEARRQNRRVELRVLLRQGSTIPP